MTAGAIAYNISLNAVFYTQVLEAATGDLVGFGLCCSTKMGAWCPDECGDGGAVFFENATDCAPACATGQHWSPALNPTHRGCREQSANGVGEKLGRTVGLAVVDPGGHS